MDYVDVYSLDDLPKVENDKRYLEFLGGTKKYRCFLVDKNMPRCDFYKKYEDEIDDILKPIYKNRGIIVAQDNTFPLPGFYIISFRKQYKSVDELPDSLSVRTSFLIKSIRKGMREKLGINFINIYYEEKNALSNNVHIWLMPKTNDLILEEKLYETDLSNYLNKFDLSEEKSKILYYNEKMSEYLKEIDFKKQDDELYNLLEKKEKRINLCISNRCFIKCLGCYNNFCKEKEIDYHKIIDFLKYAKEKGVQKVTLSGGDPLAYEHIKDIINACFDLDLKVNLDTVGLPFVGSYYTTDKLINVKKFDDYELLKKISTIGIPIDGSTNEINSTFRISNHDLCRIHDDILNLFDKLGINICINTVCHKQNIEDLINVYNKIKEHNCVKKWQIFQFMPIGPLGEKNKEKFSISNKEFELVKEKLISVVGDNIRVDFKSAEEREYNYMLVDSKGTAYKVDLDNKKEIFGSLLDEKSWENILKNLY